MSDSNTIGSIASVGGLFISCWVFLIDFMTLHFMLCHVLLPASIDWGCAVQIAAAINISNQNFVATQVQTLYVFISVNTVSES